MVLAEEGHDRNHAIPIIIPSPTKDTKNVIMKTLNEFSTSIENIIYAGADTRTLHAECSNLVLIYGRTGGRLAYEILSNFLHKNLPEQTLNKISDILDALSGQCHSSCRIGSGSYHLDIRPSEILIKKKDCIKEIIAKYPVKNAMIFGSVARGEDTEDSDLDIMVEPLEHCSLFQLGGLHEELVEELGIEISLCTSTSMIKRFGISILKDTMPL